MKRALQGQVLLLELEAVGSPCNGLGAIFGMQRLKKQRVALNYFTNT